MSNDIQTPPTRRLTKTQLRQLAAFTDPGTVLNALKKQGWTINKMVKELVDIAENTEKDSTKLNALKYLNQLIIDCLERSGMMVMATKETLTEDGDKVTFTGHVVESILQGQREQPQTTLDELKGEHYPDEEDNDDTEKKSRKKKGKTKGRTEGRISERARKRAEQDGKTRTSPTRSPGKKGKSKKGKSKKVKSKTTDKRTGGGYRQGDGTGQTKAGATKLSDDLHSSREPEGHEGSFPGIAVPTSVDDRPGSIIQDGIATS